VSDTKKRISILNNSEKTALNRNRPDIASENKYSTSTIDDKTIQYNLTKNASFKPGVRKNANFFHTKIT